MRAGHDHRGTSASFPAADRNDDGTLLALASAENEGWPASPERNGIDVLRAADTTPREQLPVEVTG
jgi:hypothetical protein